MMSSVAPRLLSHPGALPNAQCYHAAEAAMATITRRVATEEDLLAMPDDGQKYELVDGEIRVSPAGNRHSYVAAQLVAALSVFVKEHRLGYVMGADAGFRLPSKNVRSPDVSFVAAGRFPQNRPPDDFGNLAPDLAVEVLSPHDRPRHVLDKVGEYLEAGVRLIWVIDPRKASATVYRSLSDVRKLGADDSLDGEDVLPGFRCRLGEILE
jgi:Uma2 family endonuclease